jgi:hypothetical protein
MMEDDETLVEETLVEMTYRWIDVENSLPTWTRQDKANLSEPIKIGSEVNHALIEAFRVEAIVEEEIDDFGNDYHSFRYRLLFDVESADAREASKLVRTETRLLEKVIKHEFATTRHTSVEVRVCSAGVPAEGLICGRAWEEPPKRHITSRTSPRRSPIRTSR